ncbi:MAG: BamA/TamA family outer membrane protein [Saprospiraceae bacterium]|nr:BamA/TamA family outer membrane protein [Saprospiraceae bacterium]
MRVCKSILFPAIAVLLTSCQTTRFLKKDEALLTSYRIKVGGISSDEANSRLKDQLHPLVKQKPNKNFLLLFPREWFYWKAKDRKNTDSWLTKSYEKMGEAPAILDSFACQTTATNFKNFLYNMGYFTVTTSYGIKVRNQRARVTYHVQTGPRYKIESIDYLAEDSTIQEIINRDRSAALLYPGAPLDYGLFQNEKARLSELLFNHGYAEFSPVFIEPLVADTSRLSAKLVLNIKNPEDKPGHTQFSINRVRINPDFRPGTAQATQYHSHFDSLSFATTASKPFIRHELLSGKILLRPGMVASKNLVDNSYSNLYHLGTYRFISIEGKRDSLALDRINYQIQLSPNKKWIFDFGADFNYTSIKKNAATLFGISGYTNLRNRNLFRRAASNSIKFEVGTELNLLDIRKFNSLSLHLSNDLSLASFYDLTGSWSLFKMLSKPFGSKILDPDSRTNIRLSANYENLVSLYKYTSANTGIDYDWQIGARRRITMQTLGLSLYFPKTTPEFDSLLKSNRLLQSSFSDRRLLSALLLDNVTYYYQSPQKRNNRYSVIASFNLSGLEVNLANSLSNAISGKQDTFRVGEFTFSEFVKTDLDYRYYTAFRDKSSLALRLSSGIVIPFGRSTTVPYIKQFYVGGPQSIRAWNLREIGPGAIAPPESDSSSNRSIAFFSAGDFKLEGSVEFRFDIFWRLKGAVFLDAGNIWYLPKKVSDPDTRAGFLSKDFYKEIAVGTGLGLRLDLTYFLFRVDIGFQLRNAFPDDRGKYWLYGSDNPVSFNKLQRNSTIHLALDYPF